MMIRLNNKKILARQQRSQRYIIKEWVGRLKDVPAFIMGNGPSINDEPVKILDDYFTIGINRSFLLLSPTILLWQDIGLWNTEHHKLHNLQSIKVCRDISDPRHIYYNFYLKGGPFRFEKRTHILCGRGSTGPLAVQFAVALGCKPIIILGMDCKTKDGKSDFYGNNPHWTPHTLNNCSTGLKFIHDECPVKIINCSDNDVFKERYSLADVISNLGNTFAWGRQKYVSKLIKNK
jgi:hypothetical protein